MQDSNAPRDHHYVPQFFLRNFAVDAERKKLTTVMKHGPIAVWAKRSIERLGFERDLYVHLRRGVPVSVETTINKRIETPISKSDTWAKIVAGRADALDRYAPRSRFDPSTTPVLATRAPPHPALGLPLLGMVPYQLVLTLDPTTIASLVLGKTVDESNGMCRGTISTTRRPSMSELAERATIGNSPNRWTGRVLLGSSLLLALAAGGLLWWRHGAAVFGSYVVATLAWCF